MNIIPEEIRDIIIEYIDDDKYLYIYDIESIQDIIKIIRKKSKKETIEINAIDNIKKILDRNEEKDLKNMFKLLRFENFLRLIIIYDIKKNKKNNNSINIYINYEKYSYEIEYDNKILNYTEYEKEDNIESGFNRMYNINNINKIIIKNIISKKIDELNNELDKSNINCEDIKRIIYEEINIESRNENENRKIIKNIIMKFRKSKKYKVNYFTLNKRKKSDNNIIKNKNVLTSVAQQASVKKRIIKKMKELDK